MQRRLPRECGVEIEKIIRLKSQSGLSIRQISQALNLRKSTVSDYLRRFKESGVTLERMKKLSDQQLVQALSRSGSGRFQLSERVVPRCRISVGCIRS